MSIFDAILIRLKDYKPGIKLRFRFRETFSKRVKNEPKILGRKLVSKGKTSEFRVQTSGEDSSKKT